MTDLLRRLLRPKPRQTRWTISRGEFQGTDLPEYRIPRSRFRRAMLVNLPFLLGLLIVGLLVAGVILAPALAPHNPYATSVNQRLQAELGDPPYPPSALFPLGTDRLGRDILSLLLYGASTTLTIAGAVTLARTAIGLALGASAGWFQNSLVDGLIMGVARFLSAFPILLAGMILILALDIRQGLPVFVVALTLVGWSELAQYIRAEFMTIKQQPFIESARAVGLTGFGIAVRHVLPNVLPSLIALLALETGGVLMLLGELGFLSIFVGGGSLTTDAADTVVQYAIVPEWGAMLAGTRLYARTYPWLALSPAAAFFLAVVGFNLLGEGFRRIIEESGVNIALLISKRALVGIALLVLVMWIVRENTGPLAAYARMADGFSAEAVIAETRTLTTGTMAVRPPGSPGCDAAAAYIARRFQEVGLRPWGDGWDTYLQETSFEVTTLREMPRLTVVDADGTLGEFVYLWDYRERMHWISGPGKVNGRGVTFLGLNPQRQWKISILSSAVWTHRNDSAAPDLGQDVVMMLEENEPEPLISWMRGYRKKLEAIPGLLVVTRDPNRVQQIQIPAVNASAGTTGLNTFVIGLVQTGPAAPTFYITEEMADRLLATASRDLTVAGLRQRLATMPWDNGKKSNGGEPFVIEPLPITATLSIQVEPNRIVTAANVIGFLPGVDTSLDDELVIVATHYAGLPPWPASAGDGTVVPGAIDNAASLATMLEIARLWQDQDFQPRRTILFLALPDGEHGLRALEWFRKQHRLFQTLTPVAFVYLDDMVGGSGDKLLISDVDFRLHSLVSRAAEKLHVAATLEHRDYFDNLTDKSPPGGRPLGVYADRIGPMHYYAPWPMQWHQVPTVSLRWQGSENLTHRSTDTVEILDPGKVSQAGRVLDLVLRILARETVY